MLPSPQLRKTFEGSNAPNTGEDVMELLEANQLLFKGQSNVAVMAKTLDMPLETLQEEFRQYVKVNPIDHDFWQADIDICWPFHT